MPGAVLVDGFTAAHWTLTRDRDRDRDIATLSVHPYRPLTADEDAEVRAEAERVLHFMTSARPPESGTVTVDDPVVE